MMHRLTELLQLVEAQGAEWRTIHNMIGQPKKFRWIDGDWENPSAARAWMKSHEIPEPPVRASKARLEKAKAARPYMSDEAALRWLKDDEEAEKEERAAARAKKASRPTVNQMVSFAEDAIGQTFPDGDPIDQIGPYLDKHGLDFRDLDAAFKKVHKKTYYDYLADMWDSVAGDALADAKQGHHGEHYDHQWFAQGNPWRST